MKNFDPLNDFLFSKFMGSEGCENILLSFFNSIFKEVGIKRIESIDIIDNKFLSADIKGNKSCILDLRSKANDGRRINLELQNRNTYHFIKRSILYIAREISNSAKEGNFNSLKPHILINLLNFNFCKESDYNAKFNIIDIRNINCIYSNLITIINIDLVVFRRLKNKDFNNPLHRWLIFLDKNSPKKLVKKVIWMDDDIKLADKKIKEALSDEQALHDYYMRDLAKMEYISDMETSKEKGKKEGKREEKIEIASKLKNKGIPLEIIAETTNIPISKIKKL
ncbi:MAG: Rpn family recombination-promoting nuclease/putative transposase [Methanobacteriaceae archaeon]|jgi:predicted transposase/invertase (TIGR01784 family)|nr:Rpn family recombination-promoting nuclease/putative transposase [Candidatus Methanorudis spinitermitis]